MVGEGWTGVLVTVAVVGLDVGVAVTPKVGAGEAGKDVVVAWAVGGIEVVVAWDVAGNPVLVGALVGGIEVAVAGRIGLVELLVNWMAPISKEGPRGLAKKSFDIPMSEALAAAGDELEG